MSRFSVSLFFPLLAATAAAQAPSSTPHSHAGESVTLEHFLVTASPFQRDQADLAQATTVLADTALAQRRAFTLGETLSGLPGINSTWFGPGASRPIIRGLGSDRLRLLENGVGTLDASVISPDHAVSVEPLLVDRIEAVRGPASLLYGGSAIGGVVNVLTHRIETEVPERPVAGGVEARYGSSAHEFSLGGTANIALPRSDDHAVVLHLDGFHREANDVAIPGYAESAAVRAEETEYALQDGEEPPVFARGTLPNSAVRSRGGSAGLSWVSGSGHVGFNRSYFETNYGVPGHAHAEEEDGHEEGHAAGSNDGVRIELRQRRWDVQGESRESSGIFSGGRFKFGQADYEHRELEDGQVGTVYRNRGYEARAELLHRDLAGLAGTWGIHFGRTDLEALGDEAFVPSVRTEQRAVFAYEEIRRGDWTGEFGARFERQELATRDGSGRGRSDDAIGLSVGTVWNPAPGWTVAASAVWSHRAPNAQEAYAFGPHLGTNAFEFGNADLARERSLGLELSLRRRAGRVTGEVTVFAHRFSDYIFERANGLVAVRHDEHFDFEDPAELDEHDREGTLPVYEFTATDARFRGAEAEVIVHLHDETRHRLDLRLSADFVRAEDGVGDPLPRIPAARFGVGLDWRRGDWTAGVDWQQTRRQGRVAAAESPSDGYGLLSAQVSWCHQTAHGAWDVFLRATNLTDEEARPHTSFLKDLAPLPGRSATIGLRRSF